MSNIKFYAPVDFDDTSSGLTIDGDLTVDTNVLHVDTTNNRVGIGTASPSAPLTFGKSVYGAFDSENFFRIKFEDVGGVHNDVGIGQTASGSLGFNVTNGGSFIFNNGTGGEAMTIKAGNIGVGTTTPTSSKLNINSNGSSDSVVRIDAADARGASRYALQIIDSDTNSRGSFYISTSSGPSAIITGGNVLIGTTTDSGAKLNVQVTGASTTNVIKFGDATPGYLASGSTGVYLSDSSGTARLMFKHTGEVGIGTTSPSYKLDVAGELRATSTLRANSNAIVGGYLDLTGDFFHRDDIKVLNKASTNWLIWAQRNTVASEAVINLNYIGNILPGSDSAYNIGSSSVRFANGYFDTLYGDGSNLTGITATETDTLDSVTGRGSSTTNSITVGGLTASGTGQFGSYATIGTSIAGGFMMDANNGAFRANGASGNKGFYFQRYNNAGTHMFIGLEGTYLGRVGIGTTTPASTFMVHSTGTTAVSKQWQTIISDNNTLAADRGGGIIFRGRYLNSSPANFCGIRAGKLNSTNGDANAYLSLLYGAAGTMTEGVRINYNGNTLIGTTTDSGYKLAVNGDVNADGDYYSNGTQGYTGTVTIQQPSPNPPINIDIQGGIITNVY